MIPYEMAVVNMMEITAGFSSPRVGVITIKTLPMVPSPNDDTRSSGLHPVVHGSKCVGANFCVLCRYFPPKFNGITRKNPVLGV